MLNNYQLNAKTNKTTATVPTASTSISMPHNVENENKNDVKRRDDGDNNENIELLLAPWTYSCLFKPAIERVKHSHVDVGFYFYFKLKFLFFLKNQQAVHTLNVSFNFF
jgi:hypothetical protein